MGDSVARPWSPRFVTAIAEVDHRGSATRVSETIVQLSHEENYLDSKLLSAFGLASYPLSGRLAPSDMQQRCMQPKSV